MIRISSDSGSHRTFTIHEAVDIALPHNREFAFHPSQQRRNLSSEE
jgi:hypothetical protein